MIVKIQCKDMNSIIDYMALQLKKYFIKKVKKFHLLIHGQKCIKTNSQTITIQIFLNQNSNNLNYIINKKMQNLIENTTIKLSIEHNISSSKVIEARFDLNQTILAVKENIQARYGSVVAFMSLQLKDAKNNLVANLQQNNKTLGHYGAQTGMILYVIDSNPSSILKQIQSYEGVEKYMISEEDYDKLPQNFRKWKKQFLKDNPNIVHINKAAMPNTQELDPQYLGQLASTINVGTRCKLESGMRGEVAYVGKIMDLGHGYFVGIKLDEPFGTSNGIVSGVKYFDASDKYATFVRPNVIEVGDFPVLDIDDEI